VDGKLISAAYHQHRVSHLCDLLITYLCIYVIITGENDPVRDEIFAYIDTLKIKHANEIRALEDFPVLSKSLYMDIDEQNSIKFKRLLGEGSAAVVCLATVGCCNGKAYAIKVFKSADRFDPEARILSSFSDRYYKFNLPCYFQCLFKVICFYFRDDLPHLCRVVDQITVPPALICGRDVTGPAIIMNIVYHRKSESSVVTLDGALASEKMGHVSLLRIACNIADTLAYLHGREIIHGDLHSKNILLDNIGLPTLIDFSESSSTLCRRKGWGLPPAEMHLCPDFMWPPIVKNESLDYSVEVDLYAFGILLRNGFRHYPKCTYKAEIDQLVHQLCHFTVQLNDVQTILHALLIQNVT
jgi:serine/threonine protein kinase